MPRTHHSGSRSHPEARDDLAAIVVRREVPRRELGVLEWFPQDAMVEWRRGKAVGLGRERIVGEVRDLRQRRAICEDEAREHGAARRCQRVPLLGAPAALHFSEALRSAGFILLEHHAGWRTRPGVHQQRGVCRENALLSEALGLEVM